MLAYDAVEGHLPPSPGAGAKAAKAAVALCMLRRNGVRGADDDRDGLESSTQPEGGRKRRGGGGASG